MRVRVAAADEVNKNKKEYEYFYSILTYNPKTNEQKKYSPKIGANFLSEPAMAMDKEGNIIFAGLYSETNKQEHSKVLNEEKFYSKGIFITKYDPLSSVELYNNHYPYSSDLLKTIVSDKKANEGEEVLWGFSMDKIKFRTDGSVVLVAEKSYTYTIVHSNGSSYTNYQYEQLITASIDQSGHLLWMQPIPKLHSTGLPSLFRYYSYLIGITDYNVYFRLQ
ncbi:MAG: hypothetical protein JWO58_167 [Chitinophagaceae bacterium]|nr:hypothetical protein [Chitinophagaceae bacterium]